VRLVGAEDPLPVAQGALIEPDRLVQACRRLVGAGDATARGQGLRMIAAEDPLTVGQGALELGDRLVQASRRLIGAGEVVARGQNIYVTEGIGLCQKRGGPIEVIRPGDRVAFEPRRRSLARHRTNPAMTIGGRLRATAGSCRGGTGRRGR
jgi:hypothetical protein